jgi:hypothetical protein
MSNKDASRLSIRPVSVQEPGNEKSGAEVRNEEVEAETPAEATPAVAAAANGGMGNYIVRLICLWVKKLDYANCGGLI